MVIIQKKASINQPANKEINQIIESDIGTYIATTGIVTQTSGDTFVISDNSQKIKVIIKAGTNIQKPKMKIGDMVEIAGIISIYKNELRLLPIKQNDVKIITSKAILPESGISIKVYLISYFIIQSIWILFLKMKPKQKSSLAW